MTERIWKYHLRVTDEQIIWVPDGARVLSVANQNDELVLYARVNPEAAINQGVRVFIFGTGNPADIPEDARFLGTVSIYGGRLTWHVFVAERTDPRD